MSERSSHFAKERAEKKTLSIKKNNNRGVKRGVLSYFPARCRGRDVFSYFHFKELFFLVRITLYKRTNKGTRKRLFELCLGKYFFYLSYQQQAWLYSLLFLLFANSSLIYWCSNSYTTSFSYSKIAGSILLTNLDVQNSVWIWLH